MFTVRKSPPVLSPGKYQAKIVDVKAVDGQFGERLAWTIDMTHNGHAYRAMGYTPTTFYQNSQECRWAEAILGMKLEPGQELDEVELAGAPVTAIISCKPSKDGSRVFYNINDILPPAPGQEAEPAAASEEDVPF